MRLPLSTFPLFRKNGDIPLFLINSQHNAFAGVAVDSEDQSFCVEVEQLEIDTDWFHSLDFPTPNDNTDHADRYHADRYHDLHAKYLQLFEVFQAQKQLCVELENLAFLE